jgi:hypothetical protein
MKAVQVDEFGRVIIYGQQSIGGHESFWIFIIIEEIYRQFKSDCCGRSSILVLNGGWDIFACFSIFFPSLKMLFAYGLLSKTVHIQTTYILFNSSGQKRYILHLPSLDKFVQPFTCYQIIIHSLTCQMIDCTGQCESATAQWVNQIIYCNYYIITV